MPERLVLAELKELVVLVDWFLRIDAAFKLGEDIVVNKFGAVELNKLVVRSCLCGVGAM
jgi:hypothetical protein